MPKLIKDGDITEDYWLQLESSENSELDFNAAKKGKVLVPLQDWISNESSLSGLAKVGVSIPGETSLEDIPESVLELAVVAIHFPVFADGRGFSLARQIREHKDFSGDLRAIGNFALDQIYFLKRCGFSSFVISEGSDAAIHECLNAFSNSYQAAADEPRPLFRRREY